MSAFEVAALRKGFVIRQNEDFLSATEIPSRLNHHFPRLSPNSPRYCLMKSHI